MPSKPQFSCTQSCAILSDDHFFSHIMKRKLEQNGVQSFVFKTYGEFCSHMPHKKDIDVIILDSAVGTDDPRILHKTCTEHADLKNAHMVVLYERDINPKDLPQDDKTIHINKHTLVSKEVVSAVVKSCV